LTIHTLSTAVCCWETSWNALKWIYSLSRGKGPMWQLLYNFMERVKSTVFNVCRYMVKNWHYCLIYVNGPHVVCIPHRMRDIVLIAECRIVVCFFQFLLCWSPCLCRRSCSACAYPYSHVKVAQYFWWICEGLFIKFNAKKSKWLPIIPRKRRWLSSQFDFCEFHVGGCNIDKVSSFVHLGHIKFWAQQSRLHIA